MGRLITAAKAAIPFSGNHRAARVAQLQEKVNTFLPHIEHIVGVNFPPVLVRDIRDYLREEYDNSFAGKYNIQVPFFSKLGELIAENKASRGRFLSYSNGTILVPFSYWNRFAELAEKSAWPLRVHRDHTLLHELGHHVWSGLGGEQTPRTVRANEQFAEYCAAVWFQELHTEGKRSVIDTLYLPKERQAICDIVEEHGKGVLKRIPREWEQFPQLA